METLMKKVIAVFLLLGLVACGTIKPKLEGKFGKIYYSKSGKTKEFSYIVKGETVEVTGVKGTAIGIINKDGSIDLDASHYVKDTVK
jgi:hypothetical protein